MCVFTVAILLPGALLVAEPGVAEAGFQDQGGDPIVTFAVASSSIDEDMTSTTISVVLDRTSNAPVTVRYASTDGTATSPGDFTALSGELVIPAGEAGGTFTVPIVDDGDEEPSEELTLALSEPSGAALSTRSMHTVSIVDDDTFDGESCEGRPATIIGSGVGATITGTDGDDVIVGTTGNDTIDGGGGDDVICAGPGDDVVNGGTGDDRIRGQAGNDTVDGGPGRDILRGNDGVDIVRGGPDDDVVRGGRGNDHVRGQAGNDIVYGGTHDDVLYGNAGNDRLYGEEGDDRLLGGKNHDRCDGGAGTDRQETCEVVKHIP